MWSMRKIQYVRERTLDGGRGDKLGQVWGGGVSIYNIQSIALIFKNNRVIPYNKHFYVFCVFYIFTFLCVYIFTFLYFLVFCVFCFFVLIAGTQVFFYFCTFVFLCFLRFLHLCIFCIFVLFVLCRLALKLARLVCYFNVWYGMIYRYDWVVALKYCPKWFW